MKLYRNQLFIGLLSLMLVFALIGCGDDDDDDGVLEVSKAVYIVNGAAETLSVFNPETSEMQNDVLTVGKWPNDIQILNGKAYVVNTGDNNVSIIDLETLTDAGVLDIGEGTAPEKIGFVGDSKAYVSCNYTASVNVVDLASSQVTKTIETGTAPWGVAVVGQKLYVCNTNAVYDVESEAMSYGASTITVIDANTDTVIKDIDVEPNATEVVVSGNKVVIQCTGNYADVTGKLCVIDTGSDTVSQTIDLGTTPSGLAAAPNGKAYVTTFGGLLSVDIGSGSVSGPLADFGGGSGLAFDSEGNGYICVPDWTGAGDDKLLVMDASEALVGTHIPGGGASFVIVKE